MNKIEEEPRSPTFPELTVVASGSSGIEIRAVLSKAYNLVEFTLKDDVPQPVFISPWMQWEPAEMNDERLRLAHEIGRRAAMHNELLRQVTDLQTQLKQSRDTIEARSVTQETTYRMWREDRARMGMPEDFSDIKEWPPEMMGNYR